MASLLTHTLSVKTFRANPNPFTRPPPSTHPHGSSDGDSRHRSSVRPSDSIDPLQKSRSWAGGSLQPFLTNASVGRKANSCLTAPPPQHHHHHDHHHTHNLRKLLLKEVSVFVPESDGFSLTKKRGGGGGDVGGLRQILIQSLQRCFTPIDLLSPSCRICEIACLESKGKAALATRGIQEQRGGRGTDSCHHSRDRPKPGLHPGFRSLFLR